MKLLFNERMIIIVINSLLLLKYILKYINYLNIYN